MYRGVTKVNIRYLQGVPLLNIDLSTIYLRLRLTLAPNTARYSSALRMHTAKGQCFISCYMCGQ